MSWSHNKYLKRICKMKPQDIQNLQEAYSQVYDESYKDLGDKARNKGHQLLNKSKKTATRGSIYSGVKPSNTPEGEKLQNRASNQFAVSAFHNPEKAQAKSAANKEKGEKKKKAFGNRLTRSDGQGIRDSYEYDLDEAEGSYGQTPKAQQKMGDLANKRRNTPASEYSERGEKKKKVDAASRHFNRMGNPDAGNRGKKSSRPYYPAGRKGMTQKDRDWSRGADEYGHSGYDGEGGGGSLPKGKKLERQKKTGVSAESFDLYDVILSHLLDEGYASTEESADKIILNMSESWFEEILEARASEKRGLGSPEVSRSFPGREVQKQRGELGGRHWQSGGEGGSKNERGVKGAQATRLKGSEPSGKYAKMQSKKRDLGSRYD